MVLSRQHDPFSHHVHDAAPADIFVDRAILAQSPDVVETEPVEEQAAEEPAAEIKPSTRSPLRGRKGKRAEAHPTHEIEDPDDVVTEDLAAALAALEEEATSDDAG